MDFDKLRRAKFSYTEILSKGNYRTGVGVQRLRRAEDVHARAI